MPYHIPLHKASWSTLLLIHHFYKASRLHERGGKVHQAITDYVCFALEDFARARFCIAFCPAYTVPLMWTNLYHVKLTECHNMQYHNGTKTRRSRSQSGKSYPFIPGYYFSPILRYYALITTSQKLLDLHKAHIAKRTIFKNS